MLTLFHHPLCPLSRYVRLIMGEYGIEARLVEERFWERREEFMLLNPAGAIPVLVADGQPAVPGAGIIAEYIEETRQAGPEGLLPASPGIAATAGNEAGAVAGNLAAWGAGAWVPWLCAHARPVQPMAAVRSKSESWTWRMPQL